MNANWKLSKRILLQLILICCRIYASAYDFEVDGIYYDIISSSQNRVSVTYKIEGDQGYAGELHIPEKVTYNNVEYTVTSINSDAFKNCLGLTGSLVLPNSITTIGLSAFAGCKNLTGQLILPNSLKYIGSGAFSGCSSFTGTLTIPASVEIVGAGAFNNCSSFSGSLIIPSSIRKIENNTFQNCVGISSVEIPNSITSIGSYAFMGCENITHVISKIETPYIIDSGVFLRISSDATLQVPKGSINNYQDCKGWLNHFKKIKDETGIEYAIYTLTIDAHGGGSASCKAYNVNNWVERIFICEGTTVNITLHPYSGYRIKSLKVNDVDITSTISDDTYTINSITANTTLYVEFEAIPLTTYTLSVKATGNGSASYNGNTIKNQTSSFSVNEGTSVSITLTPDNGYRIKSVKENNTNVTSYVSNSKYTINSISRNTTVEVEFEAIPATTYTLSIKSVGNGSANYNSTVVRGETSAFAVSEGASATITLSPDEGYKIKRVTIDNTDVLPDIQNNRITLQNIIHDIQVDIHFENKCDSLIKEITAINELLDTEVGNCKKLLEKLKELVEKAKEIDAKGYVSYESKYAEYSIALRGCEDNRHSMEQGYSTYLNRYNEYGIEDMGIEYVNTYSDGFNSVLNTAKQLQASLDNLEENISKTYNQLNEELNNLPQTVTYTISITSSGSGSASYNGTSVRNDTKSFTVNEGTSATITFTSDNGHQISSLKVNNADVTTAIANNSYTISDIRANTTLEVVFEVMLTTVTAAGVNYTITSQALQTVSVTNGNYGQVLTVPATVTEHGKTWTVTGIETNALSGNTQLAAIIWNPEVAFTATVSNPNMLLYVKAERYAPSAIHNVVVNGTANSIVLTDAQSGNNFYCPQMFTARSISYTHNYRMTTGIGESRGWETIALPFDVQTITHETKGDIMPFAKWKSGDNRKPFWLYELTGSGFVEAGSIKAYTPYIISMPNNAQYDSQWLLNGNVTFSASNVIVGKTEDRKTATYRERTFVPNYADMGAAEGLYALNVSNDFTTNNSGMTEGSKFVLNMRQVHPFEVYMTSSSNARTYFDIFDDLSTDIKEELIVRSSQFMVGERVYDLQGRKVEHPSKKGVYIVNGKKMVIK